MSPASLDFPTLLTAARRGDSSSLDTLCSVHYPTVERIAHRELRVELGANAGNLVSLFSTGDVVQDVFRKVLASLDGFEGTTEGEFVNYVATAVRTRLLDLVRFHHAVRRDRRRTTHEDGALAQHPDPDQPVRKLCADEQVRIYFAILDGFEARERALLVRRLDGEATFEMLAEELGFPTADAARKAFNRLHARLLIRLQQSGVSADAGDIA
ncbi:MAG: sigma-70 family RNA polymerase sigma factor [Planctomycetes bacterium]|nr:sigma-70 family RNA polymerase sigma factor [Planctomycetota bacterium]